MINKVSACAFRPVVITPPERCCHSRCTPTPDRRRCATSPIAPPCRSPISNRSCWPSRVPVSSARSAASAAATSCHVRPRRSCSPTSCRPSTVRSRSATSASRTRTARVTTRVNACCSASGTRPARRCASTSRDTPSRASPPSPTATPPGRPRPTPRRLARPTPRPGPTVPDQFGKLASIAATRVGSSGVTIGENRVTVPSGAIRNFSKFQRMSPDTPSPSATSVSAA